MVKFVRLVKRRKDLTQEQFKEYWLNEHSKLEKIVIEQSKAKLIIANFVLPKAPPIPHTIPPQFDGFAEVYFDSVEDYLARTATNIGLVQRVHKDEENFCDLSTDQVRFLVEDFEICKK
jgi:hypothetical protein